MALTRRMVFLLADDPPQRILDAISKESLPKYVECAAVTPSTPNPIANNKGHGKTWSLRFRGNNSMGDAAGCADGPDAWCGKMNATNATMGRRSYAGSVRFVDEQIGHILDTLKSTSLLDNTWIIFVRLKIQFWFRICSFFYTNVFILFSSHFFFLFIEHTLFFFFFFLFFSSFNRLQIMVMGKGIITIGEKVFPMNFHRMSLCLSGGLKITKATFKFSVVRL